jgi:RNA polymerase sigma-70 factor (ECF subfamily)
MIDRVVLRPRLDEASVAAAPDAELAARLRAGEERAFEILVRRYTPRLLAVASRFLRSEEDRADAVQDAFLSAFRALGSFAGKSRLSTWLHRILVNACLTRLRAQSRAAARPLDDCLPQADELAWRREPEAMNAETRALVRACIDQLPESYRTVLVLRDLEELDTDETAQRLGASHSVVKTRLHRARRALRTLIEPLIGA